MIISKIIFFIDIFIWLLPPFRQKRNKYFIYFLLLALSDPIFYLINLMHTVNPRPYYLAVSTLTLISLTKKKLSLFLIPLAAVLILSLYNTEIQIIIFVIHFTILLYFLKDLILYASEKSKMNVFILILVMYEVSVMVKFAASYLFTVGFLFYYLTTAFEILIGLFFVIYNDKNSPEIKLQMEPKEIN